MFLYLGSIGGSLSKLSLIFKIIIIVIVYAIILFALRIMYKDIKSGGSKKTSRKKTFGLEVVDPGNNNNLRRGSVIPINREITIGRRDDNSVILREGYVSGHHARIYLRNTDYIMEDLNSTNGTILNNKKVEKKVCIKVGDEIKIGSAGFKVIG